MPRAPKNVELVKGINRLSRSAAYHGKGKWKKGKTPVAKKDLTKPTTITKTLKADKNGNTTRQVPVNRIPRYYPTEDTPKPLPNHKKVRPAKLRSGIKPGSVLILLAGRFRGKRVVFLKQLESGLLLVTGPFKINGVPLRRVNQAYVLPTSTHIPLTGEINAKFNDAYFKRPASKEKTQEELLSALKEKPAIEASRVADQKSVDKLVLEAVKKVSYLKAYLNASFSLTKGQYPHELKF